MNNKGLIATTLIYTIFVFLILIITILMRIETSSITSNVYGSDAIKEHVNKIVPYDVCLDKNDCKKY